MKKLFFTFATLFVGITLCAQNFQLHYDLGRRIYSDEEATRQNITLTYEKYKADKHWS